MKTASIMNVKEAHQKIISILILLTVSIVLASGVYKSGIQRANKSEYTTYVTETAIEETTALPTKEISETNTTTTTTLISETTISATEPVYKQVETAKLCNFIVRNISVSAEECSISQQRIEWVRQILTNMPDVFFTYNVEKIIFVDSIPQYGNDCHGMSEYASHTIYLCVNDKNKTFIQSVLYHEFGHFADVTYAGYTLYSCFSDEQIWEKPFLEEYEKINKYYPGFNNLEERNKRMEAFAMAFDAYYTGYISGTKVNLQEECPQIYDSVKSFIQKEV